MIWYGCMRSIFVAWAGVLEARVHTALTMRVNYNRWKASNALRGWANQTRMAGWQRSTLACGVRFHPEHNFRCRTTRGFGRVHP